MVMVLTVALAVALQTGPTWAEALRSAKDADTLVVALVRDKGRPTWDAVGDTVLADASVKEALSKVVVTEVPSRSPGGFRTPAGPYAVFFDAEGDVRGFATILTTPGLFVKSAKSVVRLWRAHDSLEFRTRRTGNDRDLAEAAESFAFRTDRPRAKALLSRIKPEAARNLDSDALDAARAALGEACLVAKDRSGAEDAFRALWTSKDRDLAWSSRLGLMRLYADVRPAEAERTGKEIAGSTEAPELIRKAAEAFLETRR